MDKEVCRADSRPPQPNPPGSQRPLVSPTGVSTRRNGGQHPPRWRPPLSDVAASIGLDAVLRSTPFTQPVRTLQADTRDYDPDQSARRGHKSPVSTSSSASIV